LALEDEIMELVAKVLALSQERRAKLTAESPLLGAIPELDSMAVLDLLHAIEAQYEVCIDGEAITNDRFASIQTLAAWVAELRAAGT